MSTLNNYFEYSQLAQAAYALFNDTTRRLIDILKETGKGDFTEAQAKAFLGLDESGSPIPGKGYALIPNSHQPDDGAGFSATLFRSNETGELTLAIRGADGLTDLLQDAEIFTRGYAEDQISRSTAIYSASPVPAQSPSGYKSPATPTGTPTQATRPKLFEPKTRQNPTQHPSRSIDPSHGQSLPTAAASPRIRRSIRIRAGWRGVGEVLAMNKSRSADSGYWLGNN